MISHQNQGRPFILAGHSQGSNILIYLLSEYMGLHPDVYSRMIAAYVIGCSIGVYHSLDYALYYFNIRATRKRTREKVVLENLSRFQPL